MARDYYEILGIPRNATKDEVRQSFRRLARQYHPDVNKAPDAEQRFKEINEAHEVLSDDEKRSRYDRFGHAAVNGAGGAANYTGFEEIFEDFINNFGGFGGTRASAGTRRRGPRPGADRRVDVTLTFEESVHGVDRELEFDRLELCETCEGSGAEPGTQPSQCPQCNGTGEIRQVQQTFLGSMVRVAACPRCGGKGEVILTPCKICTGSGRLRKTARVNAKIFAGMREGQQLRVMNEGDAGEKGAPNGNLYVIIHVEDHEFFKRRDDDIILDISINVAQAALGDKIEVPTVDGDVDLSIPPGTQTGKSFRLRQKGFPRLRSDGSTAGRGDQIVYVSVQIPTQLTAEQRQLFEELARTMGSQVHPQSNGRGFFDRVMSFFNSDQS